MPRFEFAPVRLPPDALEARIRTREFLKVEIAENRFVPHLNSWSNFDASFSARAGSAGLIGTSMPEAFGGRGLSSQARHTVAEEMLASGAPCGAHWVAERQSAPQILRYGSSRAKREILPKIFNGTCFFAIGMSEPDTGSDLSATRSRATHVDGGWRLNGTKVWTSNAHRAHFMIGLFRSAETQDRHAGLTQFIVDMTSVGISVREIPDIAGRSEFNEVHFEDVFVPDDMVLGESGQGWSLVTSELAYERSGPDRFLSDFQLLVQLVDRLGVKPDAGDARIVGRLVADLVALRQMSNSIAAEIGASPESGVKAAVVKLLGSRFEQELPEVARLMVQQQAKTPDGDQFTECLEEIMTRAPSFSIRGGTREILKSIVAKSLLA